MAYFLLLAVVLILAACKEERNARPLSGIRAAYWGIGTKGEAREQLELLAAHGLNTALVKDVNYVLREDLWRDWGKLAEKRHVQLFSVINFKGRRESEYLAASFRPFVNRSGTMFSQTPCPLDSEYWEASIGSRFRQLARLAKTTPLTGLLFDTEMYLTDFPLYSDVCFCDQCWQDFSQTVGWGAEIPREERGEYLDAHQAGADYVELQEKHLNEIVRGIAAEVYAIAPELQMGFLAYRDTWFHHSLIKGLGTPDSPILVFSELSYVVGFSQYLQRELQSVAPQSPDADTNQQVHYIPGIWLGRFFPEDIASQVYALATHAKGYWVFTADSLWPGGQNSGAYALHGNAEAYWAALKKANDELRKYHAAPARFRSTLPPIYLSSFYDQRKNRLITETSLNDFMYAVLLYRLQKRQPIALGDTSIEEFHAPIIYRGKALFHSLKNPLLSNLDGRIRVTHEPLADYPEPTRYRVFDKHGELFEQGSLDSEHTSVEIVLAKEIIGIISILVDSGRNAARVSFENLPYVVEASTTFPLSTINSAHAYIVHVDAHTPRMTLRASCSGQETAMLSVAFPDTGLGEQQEIADFTEIRVPFDALGALERPNIGIVRITPVANRMFEDVQWYLYNEKFPYVLTETF